MNSGPESSKCASAAESFIKPGSDGSELAEVVSGAKVAAAGTATAAAAATAKAAAGAVAKAATAAAGAAATVV